MKKLPAYLLICFMGVVCAACTKSSSTQNGEGMVLESGNLSEQQTTEAETLEEQSENEAPIETDIQTEEQGETETQLEYTERYELNTVESLEDDGKEMSAAETFRSVMNGKHSALELYEDERLFWVNVAPEKVSGPIAESIEDKPDTGLARVDMLHYNRSGIGGAVCPVDVKWIRFMCVDLDGDGTKEILASDLYTNVMVIMHFSGGEVYMTSVYSKCKPYNIYENGIWEVATGAFDLQFYKIYPRKGATYKEQLAYEWVAEGMNPDSFIYEVKDKKVTKEEHDAYVKELVDGLTPLEWYEFTGENIDKYVVD